MGILSKAHNETHVLIEHSKWAIWKCYYNELPDLRVYNIYYKLKIKRKKMFYKHNKKIEPIKSPL